MKSIPLIEHAWELHKAGLSVEEISAKIGKHRSTIFRWFAGIRLKGIRKFLKDYQRAKTGRRQKRKTDPITKARVYAIREEFRQCCGEKIQYWLIHRHGQRVALSTIYRILNQKYILRKKYGRNIPRGPVPKASKPREVIQTDTVDFGQLFAFTAIDTFTREAWVVIADELTAKAGQQALKEHFTYFNFTEILQRDGGPEFKAEWGEEAKHFCNRIRTARPYKKNEQAFIEVFNRSLRKECLGWTKYRKSDLEMVKAKVLDFLDYYNNVRPHLSLSLQAPKVYLSHLR
jgi:transposase InsO family protein